MPSALPTVSFGLSHEAFFAYFNDYCQAAVNLSHLLTFPDIKEDTCFHRHEFIKL